MNIFNNSADHVAAPRPWSSQIISGDGSVGNFGRDRDSLTRGGNLHGNRASAHLPSQTPPGSLSPQPTLSRQNIPSPSPLTSSSDLYGPDRSRIFTRLLSGRSPRDAASSSSHAQFDSTHLLPILSTSRQRIATTPQVAGIKDELALAAGKVTPGVDDTPYIQYALSALTRDRLRSSSSQSQAHYSPQSASSYFRHLQRTAKSAFETPSGYVPGSVPKTASWMPVSQGQPTQNYSPVVSVPIGGAWNMKDPPSTHWVPVTDNMRQSLDPHGRTYPALTYKPSILRPFSMIILMTLCLCMMAALITCVQYSAQHQGLTPFPGSIYTSQYFAFRILPQLSGAFILIYAQNILVTSLRVLPFVSLAEEDPQKRYLALFSRLYPKSLLWPQLVGPWQCILFDISTWLTLFTVPLLSASFTCIYRNERWFWTSVPVVCWVLVALYGLLAVATAINMMFWFRRWTGCAWDIRSIADLLPLFSRSNAMSSFGPVNMSGLRDDFQTDLRDRWFDRLGYWRSGDMMMTGGIWYSLGAVGARDDDARMVAGLRRDGGPKTSMDSVATTSTASGNWHRVCERVLPVCLQTVPLVLYTVACAILVIAFLAVSFSAGTKIDGGFRPMLAVKPESNSFSAANFLYSFLPSLIGLVFWMLFQSIDLAFRLLQPWADLSRLEGATARKSILADYAACLPLQSSWRAVRNGHWRVALLSIMAPVFAGLAVLGGGLFVALTRVEDMQVRMFPNMPVFGVLSALLLLYVGCLVVALPCRARLELPRAVTSIAGVMSLCSARELTQDSAFRAVRSRADVKGRLGVGAGRDRRGESVWFYGVVPGRDEHRASVRRMRRFTEKPVLRTVEAIV